MLCVSTTEAMLIMHADTARGGPLLAIRTRTKSIDHGVHLVSDVFEEGQMSSG